MNLRIATRGSPLALWQANHVAGRLQALAKSLVVELVLVETTGDRLGDQPLAQVGGDGLFTKEIQRAVLECRADIAVHSLKDLPTQPVEGIQLAAVPQRGPTGDVLVTLNQTPFDDLPKGAVVATGSFRRQAQLLWRRPDLRLVGIRGNVETRLRKLREQGLQGLILAQAGLERLNVAREMTALLDPQWMVPAVGQGALGIECRAKDSAVANVLKVLEDPAARSAVLAERAFLRALQGGCQAPIGAIGLIANGELRLRGVLLDPRGTRRLEGNVQGLPHEAETLGERLARTLWEQGGEAIMQELARSPRTAS